LLLHGRAIDGAHHFSFGWINHHLRSAAVAFGKIVIPITPIGPRNEFAPTRFIQTAPTRSFGNLGAFVLGDHALHLCEEFALRTVAEWVLKKDQFCIELLELLDEKPLMRIVARETIRRENYDGIEFAALRAVTQSIQRRAIESRAADAFIEEFVFW